MPPGTLVVLGELNADIIVELDAPPLFEQHEAIVPRTTITMGSSSAITACGTAALAVPTSIVGVVGDDLLGTFVLEQLRQRAVDATQCRVDPHTPTGSSTILSLPDGDRSILTHLGSIGQLRASDVPTALLARASHVHVGSYYLQYALHADLPALFASCRRRGARTSLDPNFDPTGAWDAGIADVLAETDVVFCNADEARQISRTSTVEAASAWFAARMPDEASLVVKLGAEGAISYDVREGAVADSHRQPTEDDGRALVDTVGAGDSLAAGYLAGLLRGWTAPECLRLGVRNGTASTRAAGGTDGQLTWPDVTRVTGKP